MAYKNEKKIPQISKQKQLASIRLSQPPPTKKKKKKEENHLPRRYLLVDNMLF